MAELKSHLWKPFPPGVDICREALWDEACVMHSMCTVSQTQRQLHLGDFRVSRRLIQGHMGLSPSAFWVEAGCCHLMCQAASMSAGFFQADQVLSFDSFAIPSSALCV